MRKFLDRSVTPPGGFTFNCSRTGAVLKHNVFVEALSLVEKFHRANGYPLDDNWKDWAEDRMCDNCGPRWWRFVTDGAPRPPRRVTIGDAINFVRVMGSWLADTPGGSERFVSGEEAERRAAICMACPMRVEIEGCTPCSGLLDKVTRLLGRRGTKYDSELKSCGVCGCENRVQVHFPLDALHKGVDSEMEFPTHCWKKPTP